MSPEKASRKTFIKGALAVAAAVWLLPKMFRKTTPEEAQAVAGSSDMPMVAQKNPRAVSREGDLA